MNLPSLAAWTAAFFLSSVLFSHTVALRLFLLLLGAGLAIATIARERQAARLVPAIWLPFALWAAWAALSLTWSVEPERSAKELQNEVGYAALALWVCYVGAQARDAVRIIMPVVAAAAVLACAVAFYNFWLGALAYNLGWHGGSGNFSSALLTLMPCVLAAGWYAWRAGWRRGIRTAMALLAVLFLLAAYTTQNRTIWIGLALELLIFGALFVAREPVLANARAKAVAAGVAIAIVAGGAVMTLRVQADREATGAHSMQNDPRLGIWPRVVKHIEQNPWTGYGFGRGLLRGALPGETKDELAWHAHNLFLDVTLQLGIPGLVLLLALVAATLREGLRFAFDRNDAAAACGIALIAVTVGMCVRNMTDMLLIRQNALLYWGVVGVLLAWGARGAARSSR
jgi:O-antigen ligase